MNVRIFWVRAMKCMCAQTRPRFILSSERVFGGMEFEPMFTPREKSPVPENFPRGGLNPWRCGQRAQALPTELFRPPSPYSHIPTYLSPNHPPRVDSVYSLLPCSLTPPFPPSPINLVHFVNSPSPYQHTPPIPLAQLILYLWDLSSGSRPPQSPCG